MALQRRHFAALAGLGVLSLRPHSAQAVTRRDLDEAAAPALRRLREGHGTQVMASTAKAILVFPQILRAGFGVGGQYGNGVLYHGGHPARTHNHTPAPFSAMGYYNIAGASYGLQIGAQAFGLGMFFMTDAALAFFHDSAGWEIGTGPSVVALDSGAATSMTSSTLTQPVYSVTFGQTGLMAAIGLQGNKITRITPD
jgi:lipid-binding SYLF domain-containing protein